MDYIMETVGLRKAYKDNIAVSYTHLSGSTISFLFFLQILLP